jgi:hypothetical protein
MSHKNTKQHNKTFYQKNKESIRAKAKAEYAANPKPFLESCKRYYEKNKEKRLAYAKAWRMANPHIKRAQRLKKYGITLEQFNTLLELQKFVCAVCYKQQTRTLNVDHNHTTGQIRGLLCGNCNRAIGYIYEDINIATALINYLIYYNKLAVPTKV